jgi:hypothetical protein
MRSSRLASRATAVLAALLGLVLAGMPGSAAAEAKTGVVALALWSDQGVFLSEATQAAHLVAVRYGHGGPVLVRSNARRSFAAGPVGMVKAIKLAERSLDPNRDVLFVILTSHGSPQGIAEKGGGVEGILPPKTLASLLAQSRVRQKVLLVSACYAGVYIPLADPDTLVITAADADHPSFGCEAGASWTYFGDAFFNKALRRATGKPEPLDRIFADAAGLVRARELSQGFEPSNPQIAGGAHVLATLAGMQ